MPPPGGSFPPPQHGGSGGFPGPGYPQQSWSQTPMQPPGRKRGNGWKWALGGVALVAVVGVTAAVTLSVANNGSGGGSSPISAPQSVGGATSSDIASANDTGPVTVITEDPTCAPKYPILET